MLLTLHIPTRTLRRSISREIGNTFRVETIAAAAAAEFAIDFEPAQPVVYSLNRQMMSV